MRPNNGSNNSATGLFEENFTLETWKKRYVDNGGFPMLFFSAALLCKVEH